MVPKASALQWHATPLGYIYLVLAYFCLTNLSENYQGVVVDMFLGFLIVFHFGVCSVHQADI